MEGNRKAGFALIAAGVLVIVGQLLAVSGWAVGDYLLRDHAIGDLGMSSCTMITEDTHIRYVCSGGYAWFRLGTGLGAAALLLAVLLWRRLPAWPLLGTAAAIATAGVIIPDPRANAHVIALTFVAAFTWIAMALVIAKTYRTRRPVAVITAVLLLVSVIGVIIWLTVPALSPGLFQRLGLDTLLLWLLYLGATLATGKRDVDKHQRRDEEQKLRDEAVRRAARELG